ncbi:MAG TPA: T9SS type A sorting domain-containing protein [Bacteroidia bacterium]|nr:T9SS type A sorting domain-containing protein [Bacteroidia bacterium]
MKKILLISLIIFSFSVEAQNLVPNGDFEQYSSCPNGPSQLDSALFWFNPGGGSPDYLNQCSGNPFSDVPNNVWGYQAAYGGNGYCGIYLVVIQMMQSQNYREYVEVPLTSPLISNLCYDFEMYINLGNICSYTTDDIGVYFSDTAINGSTNYYPLPFIPQINNISGNMPDSINWMLVNGSYTASGGESYLIIGNFKNDANTDTVVSNGLGNTYSYVYIDDVSLTPCKSNTVNEPVKNSAINIYPSLSSEDLIIEISVLSSENKYLSIYNSLSQEVLFKRFTEQSYAVGISSFQNGIYFVEVRSGKEIVRKKFVKM